MAAAVWGSNRSLMTLRVSRDSGRTWGPKRTFRPRDVGSVDWTSCWPPCQCPRHRERTGKTTSREDQQ